jgi:transmembrane sensor
MEDYTLKDLHAFMQDVFNQELIINNSDLLKERISGSMPIVYNVDTMLVQFSKAFQLHFSKKNNKIWVQK